MEITGKIIAVLPERGGISKTGNEWKTQEYVIETHEQYPRKVCFNVFGADKIAQFNIQAGEEMTVSFDINAGIIAESLINYIGMANAILFGVYNGLLGGLFFFILSLLLRMWSRNCKHSPWPLLITKLNNKGKQDHE